MQECLYLISKGIDSNISFNLDLIKRKAFVIILKQMESGQHFNFDSWRFEE